MRRHIGCLVLIGVCQFVLCSSAVCAQAASEFALGAARVGALTGQNGAEYAYGPIVRASVGATVLPHVELLAGAQGIAFDRPKDELASCFSNGDCATNWGTTLSGIVGLSGSARVDLDSRGRFYASLGVGAY